MSWSYAYTPYIWPMLASAMFMAGLAVYAWKHRTVPGASPFAIQMLFSALWALFTALEIATTSEADKMLWYRLGRMSAPPALTALLVFALEYAQAGQQATRRIVLVLLGLALSITAFLATNDAHHLYWSRLWFDGFVRAERGSLGPIALGYVLLLPTLALVIFLRLAWRSRGIYRTQALLLFAGNAMPVFAFLLEPAGITPVAPLNPTILTLNLTGLLFTVAIYRFGMLGVIPVGREMAVERMADGLIILDAEGRIADLNPAAREVLGLTPRRTIGHPTGQVLAAYPELASLIQKEGAASTEMSVTAGGQSRHLQMHASPLVHAGGFRLGRLIALHDVTEQKRTDELVLQQQRALAVMAERERLARELHDDLGQVLGYVKMQARAAREQLAQQQIGPADQYLAELIDVVHQTHADVRDYILGTGTVGGEEAGFLPALEQYLRAFEGNFKIRTELAAPDVPKDAFEPMVAAQGMRIIQEALTNVRKHAHAQCVQVRLDVEGALARVVIQDDGAGFDPSVQAKPEGAKFGLRSMRERAEEVDGRLEVISSLGHGTQVIVHLPMRC